MNKEYAMESVTWEARCDECKWLSGAGNSLDEAQVAGQERDKKNHGGLRTATYASSAGTTNA